MKNPITYNRDTVTLCIVLITLISLLLYKIYVYLRYTIVFEQISPWVRRCRKCDSIHRGYRVYHTTYNWCIQEKKVNKCECYKYAKESYNGK